MELTLTKEEASLVRYACNELAYKRAEQAIISRRENKEWAQANEKEAKAYFAIAQRINEESGR